MEAAKIFVTKKNYSPSELDGQMLRRGMCGVFKHLLGVPFKEMAEAALFDPGHTFWLDYNKEGDDCRIMILLLCAEMCKD